MPVTPSYPGLYIEELPLSAHSISPAPTSITVIVGFTHPIKTKKFQDAVHLFSFTEYEREFGGLFKSAFIEPHVPLAVNQFFINGGSDLYVVGLDTTITKGGPLVYKEAPELKSTLTPTGGSIVIRPLEPVDMVDMTISFNNVSATLDTFDLVITYGRRVESFRGLTLGLNQTLWKVNGASSLITVEDATGKTDKTAIFGSAFGSPPVPVKFHDTLAGYTTSFDSSKFTAMFQAGTSLDKVPIFNILLTPGIFDATVNSAALAFAERKRAFVILDAPVDSATDGNSPPATPITDPALLDKIPLSENGAIYFPYLQSGDPVTGDSIEVAPSGYVAGIYARTDNRRGVWKAPAGIEATLNNTTGVVARGRMTNEQQGVLYGVINQTTPINCLRSFPGAGTVVFGARTLVGSNQAYNQSKYVPVRRMTLFIEQTLLANLRWVVFEPNDEPLWISIRTSIENFMLSLFNQHALQGTKPSEAFQVKCDKTTTTQQDIDNGIVNIIVAFAPLKPAEFVIIKIAQLAGQSQTA